MKGIVFDIQRFALHDGPGIRTTVFLKGCPLRCLWCHNPESMSPRPQLARRITRSDEVPATPVAVHQGPDPRLAHGASGDGALLEACPAEDLEMIGREMSVDDVMNEVLRDAEYYVRSGGGLTLSGGEPLYQLSFARALLRAARAAGIHTCVDTSGQVSREKLATILHETDLFLYDYKATDPEEHRRLTGVSNELILSNLAFLYENDARIVLRCPLVPGVNDHRYHLQGIAALSERYPGLDDVQILPYHAMGREKYDRIGATDPLPGVPSADAVTKEAWIAALHRLGCTRAHLG